MNLHARARRVGGLIASAVVAAALMGAGPALATPGPTSAPTTSALTYVNLGDSYSAGSGVVPTAPGTLEQCAQSADNYSHLIAQRFGYHLTDVSCGGATTDDFFGVQYPGLHPQLDALGPGTDLVTFMIGGNDGMVFAGTVGKCLAAAATTLGRGSPCKDTYGDTIANEIRTQTFPKLVNAMRAIRSKAPHARIAVISYPWIMPATYEPCPAFPVAAGDVAYTYDIQATLNDAIRRSATETGVTFVDATTPSVGHDSCKPVGTRWIEPILTTQQIVPVHPNALGERELASITAGALGLGR
ncbi:MAG TPA: SGNH/GDSL hydrolase family protein [Gordonia polyisoprenivorans]|uniref:SGNH/GDSL hydrolase family protein n=1 Tax=Gordonia polyisoprenivorans TaxID=84595 RepID=UPI00035DE41E|nr:SGNH/GDSL hydrolase family protein [Gordonia polyisoprenivorans]MBE7191969.1 SGNH/GDSL hydrolase family protein [Gordonia polyisoprenivorans]UZF58002.1 SGNH/GDSL hydrolase family protein [Gordonia polyisoprenivorans]HCS58387.1 SGNH/GDSL hydrolase family protein [Gordonia polyisoprenivorans]